MNPKLFISYSQDSEEYRSWVQRLVDRLISDGIDTKSDIYDLTFGDKNPEFMERCISEAEFVILLLTENYVNKANQRIGGVGYEIDLATGDIVVNGKKAKYIPVFIKIDYNMAPRFLLGSFGIKISNLNSYDEEYIKIYSYITNQAVKSKPKLGNIKTIDELRSQNTDQHLGNLIQKYSLSNYTVWTVTFEFNSFSGKHISQLYPTYQKYFLRKKQSFGYRYFPFVINPEYKKGHGDFIEFESDDFSAMELNVKTFDRLVMSENKIKYSETELTDTSYNGLSSRIACLSILHLMFFYKIICDKEGLIPDLTINLNIKTNIERFYSISSSLFHSSSPPFDTYITSSMNMGFDMSFTKFDINEMYDFFVILCGLFVSKNKKSTNPYLNLDRKEFENIYNSMELGNYV